MTKKCWLVITCVLTLGAWPAMADTLISINTNKPGAVINKNIYGHFAEHIGAGIYEGLWVGPGSKIPNTKGWRNDVLAALRELKVPVVRWPGGCFADDYHWRDGIGPREERPVRLNTLWGGIEETNAVGTHEFFELAELLCAETYINGNLGSGSPKEMKQWIEYLTSDSQSTLVKERRKNGRDKPFKVDHFGIGNESWGCGGYMSPEYYASLYKQWSTFIRPPWTTKINWVASGGHAGLEMPALSVSAAEKKGSAYVLALVNSDAKKVHAVRINSGNKHLLHANARQLSAAVLDAFNSVEQPQQVKPKDLPITVNEGVLMLALPPASITVIELQ